MLKKFVEKANNSNLKVAVIGDGMLDEYYSVEANRVSPEFPIPVMKSSNKHPINTFAGGAANVCSQFKHWSVDLHYFGITDSSLNFLVKEFAEVHTRIGDFKVPRKQRFYSDGFPLCRWDVEDNVYGSNQLESISSSLAKEFCSEPYDVAIFSDYAKGLFVDPQEWLSNKTRISVVDPKDGPLEKWNGCTLFKPNSKEAYDLTGESDWKTQCKIIQKKTNCKAVIITRGAAGVCVYENGNYNFIESSEKVSAESVIGAGDCFVTYLSIAYAIGYSVVDAARIAYDAGRLYVQNKFNKPLCPVDLWSGKLINPEVLSNRNFSLCFTNGCFDILHPGHISTINYAKSLADKLVVAVNTDESIKRLNKSHDLVNNLYFRKTMLSALSDVDFIVEFNEDTPYEVIKKIKPDVLVKGSQYEKPVGSDIVPEVHPAPMVEGFSTTKLIEKIRNM